MEIQSSADGMQAGEKTKSVEELASAEQQRLERFEAQRLKRLRGTSGDDLGGDDSASEEEDGLSGQGGFAARRAKRRKREAQGVHLQKLLLSHCMQPFDCCS